MVHLSTPLPHSDGASLTSQPYDNPLGLVQVHHMPHRNNRPCGPLDLILQHLLNMLRCYILALIHKQTPSSFVCTKPFDIPQQPCWWPQTYNHRTPYRQQNGTRYTQSKTKSMTNCPTDYNLTDRMVFSESRISRDRCKQRSICTNPIQMNEDYGEIPLGSDKVDIDDDNFKELDPDMY